MARSETQPAQPALPQDAAAEAGDPALLSRITYNLFISLVTLLSLVTSTLFYWERLPDDVREVLYFVNYVDALVLLSDFVIRVIRTPRRMRYLLSWGLFDFIGSLPGPPFLRFFRVPSLVATWYHMRHRTSRELVVEARSRLAESTLLSGILVVFLVATVGAMAIVYVESPVEGSNIKTGSDALWYALVTIATVGYGDRYPVTQNGRLIGAAMIVVGVGIFSVITGFISTRFLAKRRSSGPSEIDLLRQDITRQLEEQRRLAAADRAALEERIEALHRELNRG